MLWYEHEKSRHARHYNRRGELIEPQAFFEAMLAGKRLCGVSINSKRYRVFHRSGTKCVACGLEGVHFARERAMSEKGPFHYNLYGIMDGREVLMTRDHIFPLSLGGTDAIENQQTMCFYCNQHKGASV